MKYLTIRAPFRLITSKTGIVMEYANFFFIVACWTVSVATLKVAHKISFAVNFHWYNRFFIDGPNKFNRVEFKKGWRLHYQPFTQYDARAYECLGGPCIVEGSFVMHE